MPLSELAAAERVVGEKEVRRALAKGLLRKVFVAIDAESGREEGPLDGCRGRRGRGGTSRVPADFGPGLCHRQISRCGGVAEALT